MSHHNKESEDNDPVINLLTAILQEIRISNQIQQQNNVALNNLLRSHNSQEHLHAVAVQSDLPPSTVSVSSSIPASTASVTPLRRPSQKPPTAERFDFSRDSDLLDNESVINKGDRVVITHKYKGQFGLIGTVFKVTKYYVFLRTSIGESIQKQNDKVALLLDNCKKPANTDFHNL